MKKIEKINYDIKFFNLYNDCIGDIKTMLKAIPSHWISLNGAGIFPQCIAFQDTTEVWAKSIAIHGGDRLDIYIRGLEDDSAIDTFCNVKDFVAGQWIFDIYKEVYKHYEKEVING